ncbi:golgin subfamily A member 2 [Drosophila guanche]|uniref:Blast:Golgin subfamily A member 2 n=1 Tax=Drosophila guanche TaxID=7266 RepID=A0A3B0JJH4_DROGU|nr:golgin subfamily A member 2 [Drosophila guanche]SPP72751.1 blast:Golgin subfamily A member 2 [Drosophila guanche]
MADDTQDAKAQKLAAARKKLKEYQQRNNSHAGGEEHLPISTHSSTVSIASNLSERSDSEVILNENGAAANTQHVQQQSEEETTSLVAPAALPNPTAAAFFTQPEPEPDAPIFAQNGAYNESSNLQAIQVIIAEKALLNAELTRARLGCRERELELEEVRTEHAQTRQRLEQLQQHCQGQQAGVEMQRQHNAQLQHKLAQSQAQIEDQQSHLLEMEAQLKQLNLRQDELQRQLAEKSNELEMAQLKLRQLSDESNINADNRVESLTQTQYMYEQQIRDLQAMVGQLTQDKEQASSQYQNYVQHQSSEIAKLNEKNSELTEELLQLRERERQLVEHVSGLERDIQKNLSLQAQFKEASQPQAPAQPQIDQTALTAELAALKERLSDFDFERHEFQLKIKSQDDQLHGKEAAIAELEQQLDRLQAEQPDQTKLLATMESDKVAASRALSQNVEMKQQLDELEQKFVQLTNDKAELVIRLDAEEFANREIRHNFDSMQQKLLANEERFKFKDEEMIRLSHENVELQRQQLMLKQQLDRLKHYEVNAYHSQSSKPVGDETGDAEESETKEHHAHDHDHPDHHSHDHSHDHHDPHDHSDGHSHEHSHGHSHDHHQEQLSPGSLPTAEAVERLQARFTTLISQVADLTEEKHSLEHLVLQLQGETETIGEYIALYQTQRRMLKQREYEKATQMSLLQAEREQLREKIEALNKLVASLGVELPADQVQGQPQAATLQHLPSEQAVPRTQTASHEDSNGENSQQILNKIQSIITEIKENTEQPTTALSGHPVDHLNCCLGKFEVV